MRSDVKSIKINGVEYELDERTVRVDFDNAGRHEYDVFGKIIKSISSNGRFTHIYEYDGYPRRLVYEKEYGSFTLKEFRYEYDKEGNKIYEYDLCRLIERWFEPDKNGEMVCVRQKEHYPGEGILKTLETRKFDPMNYFVRLIGRHIFEGVKESYQVSISTELLFDDQIDIYDLMEDMDTMMKKEDTAFIAIAHRSSDDCQNKQMNRFSKINQRYNKLRHNALLRLEEAYLRDIGFLSIDIFMGCGRDYSIFVFPNKTGKLMVDRFNDSITAKDKIWRDCVKLNWEKELNQQQAIAELALKMKGKK